MSALVVGCSSDTDDSRREDSSGLGGASSSSSSAANTGGATSATRTGGATSVGGSATGGTSQATGGTSSATGGTSQATGGTSQATGGTSQATGGTSQATGGTSSATGGTSSATGGTSSAKIEGPCDIYDAGKTPCVAAHSTVRALYGAYAGKLYQVRRASDKKTQDIGLLSPGGIANAAEQDTFCAGTTCTISIIYDQSPQHNDLTRTTGGWIGNNAKEADAAGISIKLKGHKVYGVHIPLLEGLNGTGYRNNAATGTAEGDEPESMYMVANGRAYSNECCFDYGNAERNSLNNGPKTMEAIYFGNCTSWGSGEGKGPWVMADLEEGLFSGKGAKLNTGDKSLDFDYVTAMLKGQPHQWAIKAGNSRAGALMTMYEGAYPNGYDPMLKEGAIVLGTGGDNSYKGVGDFFEGAMTFGYASDETDDAVQANIVAAGYGQ